MQRGRSFLLLIVAAVALGSYIYFFEYGQRPDVGTCGCKSCQCRTREGLLACWTIQVDQPDNASLMGQRRDHGRHRVARLRVHLRCTLWVRPRYLL